jgi:beta-lactamase regulating signal transducer with metallopeptidase domain
MTLTAAIDASTSLLAQLANPAGRSLALGCAAGLGLAAFRVKTTSVRLFTWTAVLYVALAMPLLGWMLPPLSIPTPAYLQLGTQLGTKLGTKHGVAANGAAQPAPRELQASRVLAAASFSPASGQAFRARNEVVRSSFQQPLIPWNLVAAAIYLAGAFFFLVRFFVGITLGRRLKRASRQINDPRLTIRLASRSRALGVRFNHAAESEFISVPVTMGALRSTILLPPGWREWDDAKLDAVVAHEMSHVARRDALTQQLSLLYRAIFWFSPLAWWLDRHLADLAEQASDEAALSCGADSRDYARTLLGFFESLHAAPGRVWWQGVAMAKRGQAEQRVERILAWKGNVAMSFRKSIAVVIVALAVPAIYLAAAVHPANQAVAPSAVQVAQDPSPPTPPSAPHHARPPKPPSGPAYSYSYGYDDDQRFVIVSGKTDSLTMSGSVDDARMVEELRKTIPGDFIWFERDDKSYIIRDQATIDRARKFWAPQEELGKKQEALGKQQEELGKQQEALGAKMEQIQVRVPDMTADLDKLKAELKKLNSSATVEQVGEIQSEIGELQSKIGELQSQAGDQQSKLGEEMGALGEKQGKLGEQQGELGRQQGELARQAARQMKQLLDEAITKGTATLLKPSPASL